MLRQVAPLAIAAFWGASTAAAATQPSCSLGNPCPEETPCCSQYGQCGVGAYCLGGCDPRMSFSLDSCTPEPVCVSKTYPMTSTDGIVDVSKYYGDASKADWVVQGQPLAYNGKVLLTMPPKSVGTVMASTTYLWYGNVKAKLKTGRGAGVVTAFILLSDVKDEIDYEWVGADLMTTQTNYYFQGIPNYDNTGNISSTSSTFDDEHTYEIRWTPESVEWWVDGVLGRTKLKKDTWNATSNQWDFPQTPARVQLSIWPGGLASNAEGTIAWAGGLIDWASPDIVKHGYDYATVGEVTVSCYQTNSAPGTNKGVSYTYDSSVGTNDTVVNGDKGTVIGSFSATGLDMDVTDGSATKASGTAAAIPGLSGGGIGTNGQAAGNAAGGSSSSNSNSNSGSGTASGSTCKATGFSQSCNSDSALGSTNDGARREHVLGASAFGALVAIAGMVGL